MKTYNRILARAVKKKFVVMKLVDEENFTIDYQNSITKSNQWFTKSYKGIPRKIENLISVFIYILTLPLKIIGKGIFGFYIVIWYILIFLLFVSYLLGHNGFFWE